VHSVSVPDAAARRTASGRLVMLLVLLACAAPVIASYIAYFVIRPEARTNYGTLVQPSRAVPAALPLVDLAGQPVTADSLRGQWLLVVVGPGACGPDCERQLLFQRQLRETLGRERDRIDKVWLVTDDAPLAPALRAAVTAGVPVTVLRAPREAVARWLEPEPGRGLDEHLYLVDPMGEWMMRWPARPDPPKVKRDLERLLRASGWWDQPGR
jgi:hypothetical protein